MLASQQVSQALSPSKPARPTSRPQVAASVSGSPEYLVNSRSRAEAGLVGRESTSKHALRAVASPAQAPPSTLPVEPPNVILPPAPDSIVELTPSTYQDYIAQESKDSLVLVDFYTDWCGPCKLMDAHLHHLTFAFKGVKFAKFNCGVHEDFSTSLRIRSLPTFRLFHKRKCLEQLTGAQPVKLRQLLVHYFRPRRS